ncbi:MAG: DUF2341 domain-containing protein [Fibrobacterota bacterium]|nr:DUF2341 domain-containing protein [Chitinispirillaceae bacterium]
MLKPSAIAVWISTMLYFSILQCTQPVSTGGSSSETVIGKVVYSDGTPACSASIILYPSDYDPVKDANRITLVSDTTGPDGTFSLHVPDITVTYSVLAKKAEAGTCGMVAGIIVTGDTTLAKDAVLLSPGNIKIAIPETCDTVNGYLYIPGTEITASLGSNREVFFDNVPAETDLSIIYASKNSSAAPFVLATGIRLLSNETTFIPFPLWKFSKRLYFNTTATGASVEKTSAGVPVLLRLTSEWFNFNEATTDGSDIRFTKSNGLPLSYEIEHWDPITNYAEIWVKPDTIWGNNNEQYITMHWGNAAAQSQSNASLVFDTIDTFNGVWHLSENSGTIAKEATFKGNSGTYYGALPNGNISDIGNAQTISNPAADIITMGNVLNPELNNLSIGVWIKRSSLTTPQALVAKTNGDLPSAEYGYLLSIDPDQFPHFNIASGGTNWGDDSSFSMAGNLAISDTTTWHFIFVVIDRSGNNNCRIFIDGIDRTGKISGDITKVTTVTNSHDLRLGNESDDNSPFFGMLAEATIAFSCRSPEWLKLSYMNQKVTDELIRK